MVYCKRYTFFFIYMKIFNPQGSDKKQDRKIFGGNSTNIINLNNVKYEWATQLFDQMQENFWIPEKVDVTCDVNDYKELTDDERHAYIGILSYLTFLDSIQVTNLPNLLQQVTAPEVKQCIAMQLQQEAIHNRSYQVLIETLIPTNEREGVYGYWRTDKVLFDRCNYIGSLFQAYEDTKSLEDYGLAVYADYLLEGLYFYSGFQFFYNLSSRNMMQGTADMITLINRDELSHVRLYQKCLPELLEYTKLSKDLMVELMANAVEQEMQWATHICNDSILGFSHNAIEGYVKYLADKRLKAIGLPVIYGQSKNPLKHLETIADLGGDSSVKGNFFEGTVTQYSQSTAIDGWDNF